MENINTDARKLTTEQQQEKRDIAIKLWKKDMAIKEISEIIGVHSSTIYAWKNRYIRDGKKSIKISKRGREKGANKTLTELQEGKIIRKLINSSPQQLQFKFALWTREAVKHLIKNEFEIDMPISTVGRYLKRWQFTSKKPIKRAYERKDEKTIQWLKKDYPRIRRMAKKDNADIWWGDETACVSLPTNLKGYAPIGSKKKPILTHPAKKFKINMISAITNTGKTMFSLYDESVNVDRFIDFLQKVIDSSDKKVYMIVDNLRVHHAKIVKAWIEENKDDIALFYLLAYSPDYNPDEYLNQDYKRNANKNNIPKTKKELEKNTIVYMNSIVKNEEKVANFFKHNKIRYAA